MGTQVDERRRGAPRLSLRSSGGRADADEVDARASAASESGRVPLLVVMLACAEELRETDWKETLSVESWRVKRPLPMLTGEVDDDGDSSCTDGAAELGTEEPGTDARADPEIEMVLATVVGD